MSISTKPPTLADVDYPDSDGQPMAENTLQFRWIVTIQGGLDALFRDDPNVFVAGDLLWYPVEGDNKTRMAPDAMVAFGRPKGYRGSYMQFREAGIAPQVVFEVLSPGNRKAEMKRKHRFYAQYGVEEYYLYDPEGNELKGWLRAGEELREIPEMNGWVSPRLGIRFDLSGSELRLIAPDGTPFSTYIELVQQRDELSQQRDALSHQRDELSQQRDAERQKAERLAAQLRNLGIEPEA